MNWTGFSEKHAIVKRVDFVPKLRGFEIGILGNSFKKTSDFQILPHFFQLIDKKNGPQTVKTLKKKIIQVTKSKKSAIFKKNTKNIDT